VVKDLLGVRIQRDGGQPASVALIVAADGSAERLPGWLSTLQESNPGKTIEVILTHDGPRTPARRTWYSQLERSTRAHIIYRADAETRAATLNRAARSTRADVLLFLEDTVEPIGAEWLDELLLWIEQPGIGVAGGKLLYPDGRLHQGCLVIGLHGFVGRLFHGMAAGPDVFGNLDWYRNCLAVGGACLMIRRLRFEALGGFDEDYQMGGHDVDLCLRLFQKGQRIVMNPYACFRYHGAEGAEIVLREADAERLRRRCRPFLLAGDPYFNPNLSRRSPQPRFRDAAEPLADERPQTQAG
jgi:cellulose synthase/poly-beta-1,6-N-acetylglucosamine synthase-like glycosyltransferase